MDKRKSNRRRTIKLLAWLTTVSLASELLFAFVLYGREEEGWETNFPFGLSVFVLLLPAIFMWIAYTIVRHCDRIIDELTKKQGELEPYKEGLKLLSSGVAEVLNDFWSKSDRVKSRQAHEMREELETALTRALVVTAQYHGNINPVVDLVTSIIRTGAKCRELGRGGNDLALLALSLDLNIEKANNERREHQSAPR